MEQSTDGENPAGPPRRHSSPRLSGHEWLLLLVLAAVQFVHILDFMIIMPLGSLFINGDASDATALHLSTGQFGLVVSAYTISAGLASLFAARYLDRFGRKFTLLTLLAGFTLGTFLCAAAATYPMLLFARSVAGAFGGVCSATVLAIVGDAFPDSRRGTAMGVVMSAFSIASIAGVPIGLFLSEDLGWRAPFAMLAILSGGVLALAAWVLPPLRGHLDGDTVPTSAWMVALEPNHLRAFALTASLMGSSFLIIPYLATAMVANVGLHETDLKLIYFVGGLATLLSLTTIGRLADLKGKLPVFRVLALATCVPFLAITLLPHGAGVAAVLAVTTLMFITTSGRMVPAMALIANSAIPAVRGSFMSFNSAVQQLSAGLASWVGGLLLHKELNGQLEGYSTAGMLACGMCVVTFYLAGRLRAAPTGAFAPDAEIADDQDAMPNPQPSPHPEEGIVCVDA